MLNYFVNLEKKIFDTKKIMVVILHQVKLNAAFYM